MRKELFPPLLLACLLCVLSAPAFADDLSLHADVQIGASVREPTSPGMSVDGSSPAGFDDVYLYSDASNSAFSYSAPGSQLTTSGSITLGYAASDKLTFGLPLRFFSAASGGDFIARPGPYVLPGVTMNVAEAGALDGLSLRAGMLDDFVASRMGLAFAEPSYRADAGRFDQQGLSLSGTFLGVTDFRVSVSRVEPTYLHADPNAGITPVPAAFALSMINGRANHLFPRWAGAEVGLTFNHLFDAAGRISERVWGMDFQAPLAREALSRRGVSATLLGEAAANASDSAAVAGVKLELPRGNVSLRYQDVGVGYLDGAPLRYAGAPPALLSTYGGAFLPDFIGFSNTLGLNAQYAGQAGVTPGSTTSALTGNPAYTYIYPAYSPFRGQGPFYFQAFAPNSRGYTATANVPIALKRSVLDTSLSYQHLAEISPNSLMASVFGPSFASNVRMTLDAVTGGGAFTVPIASKKVRLNFSGSWERLRRIDQSLFPYYPFALHDAVGEVSVANPSNGVVSGSPATSAVSFYPNYADVAHTDFEVGATAPLADGVSFSALYGMQRFGGSYAPPGNGPVPAQNMSQHKSALSGSLTYDIPRTKSSLTLRAASYRFVDDVLPSYNTMWNREDLNFAVRF